MHSKLISIPRSCCKYYRSFTFQDGTFFPYATVEEIEAYEMYTAAILNSHNIKFLGWAIVKPAYFNVLAERAMLGVLAVGQKSEGGKALFDISNESIKEISREYLDSLF